jgi:hypothetical protein
MTKYTFILLLIFSSKLLANQTLLHANVSFNDFKGIPADEACNEKPQDNAEGIEAICISWAGYYIYNAQVKEVLLGDFKLPSFTFAIVQHSPFVEETPVSMYLVIEEMQKQSHIEFTGTKYHAVDWGLSKVLICFRKELKEARLFSKNKDEYCYIKSEL